MSDVGELSCQELVEVVTAYLDGSLPQAERARVEETLRQAQKIEAIDKLVRHLDQLQTDLLCHKRLNTQPNEVQIALAYTEMKRALRLIEEPTTPAAVFTLEEERLGIPSNHEHAERAP